MIVEIPTNAKLVRIDSLEIGDHCIYQNANDGILQIIGLRGFEGRYVRVLNNLRETWYNNSRLVYKLKPSQFEVEVEKPEFKSREIDGITFFKNQLNNLSLVQTRDQHRTAFASFAFGPRDIPNLKQAIEDYEASF